VAFKSISALSIRSLVLLGTMAQNHEDIHKLTLLYGTVNVQTCPTSAARAFILDINLGHTSW